MSPTACSRVQRAAAQQQGRVVVVVGGVWLSFALCLAVLLSAGLASCASFYGLSYAKLSLYETRNTTQIEFRFKTHQTSAFLFLAAGAADYCFVYLHNGQLAAKLNFGAGETYLSTEELQWNDLEWHRVRLKQADGQLSMTVDEKWTFLQDINGDTYELSVQMGIFLGAQHQFKGLYLGNVRPLRGCLEAVTFNERDVLAEAFRVGITHQVTTACDEEFSAPANASITFTQPTESFIVLPSLSSYLPTTEGQQHRGLVIELDVRTISNNALLVFSPSVHHYRKEFVVVELLNGVLKFSTSNGLGHQASVQSNLRINTGRWYHVQLTIDYNDLVIRIDDKFETRKDHGQFKLSTDYAEEMYFGGVPIDRQSTALNYGLQSILVEPNVSLKGCLKNVNINDRPVTLLDVVASHNIKAGKCRWIFVCLDSDKTPCTEDSRCHQDDLHNVRCVCRKSFDCVRAGYHHKIIRARSEHITICDRQLAAMSVPGGGTTPLPRDLFDSLQLNQSEPRFEVIRKPAFGFIENTESNVNDFFSLAEIEKGMVQYRHDNSELHNDSILFRLTTQSPDGTLAQLDTTNHCQYLNIRLPVIVQPSKDAPAKSRQVIHLRVAKNSRKLLALNLLKASKLRKKSENVLYRIVNINDHRSYFERVSRPEVSIDEFHEIDLRSQAIRFVHVGRNDTADDDDEDEKVPPVEVTIQSIVNGQRDVDYLLMVEPLEAGVSPLLNTGLVMVHNSQALISSKNLSYVPQLEMDNSQTVKYKVIVEPKHGAIQKLRSQPNNWVNASHFTQRQIDRHKIRYIHLGADKPENDSAELRLAHNQYHSAQFTFRIAFITQLSIISVGSNFYNLSENEKEITLGEQEINYRTEPLAVQPANIRLTLLSVPRIGDLFLAHSDQKHVRLTIGSMFHLNEVHESRLSYVLKTGKGRKREMGDHFDYEVAVIGQSIMTPLVVTFNFSTQQIIQSYRLINNKLIVSEGGREVIDQTMLYYLDGEETVLEVESDEETRATDPIRFNITRPPRHGSLQLLSQNHSEVVHRQLTSIAQVDIKRRLVVYRHDDSENGSDSFEFAITNGSEHQFPRGTFHIEVVMKNDNSPMRTVTRPFHVIRNGERRLLGTDINYHDEDGQTTAADIVYSKTYLPSGNFYFANDTVANSFNQEDINMGRIRYRHAGEDNIRAILWVTDGQYYLSGLLDIVATDPSIEVANNTGLLVRAPESTIISVHNLSISTNIDLVNKSWLVFHLDGTPQHGQLVINERAVTTFTLQELEEEVVEYEPKEVDTAAAAAAPVSSRVDELAFTAIYQSDPPVRSAPINFGVRIYSPNYFQLMLVNMANMTTFEEQPALLDASILLVKHAELSPAKLEYRLTRSPRHGLVMRGRTSNASQALDARTVFTQQDIDDGLVYYQSFKFDLYSEELDDAFDLRVGNELVSQELTLYVQLIPKLITLYASNLSVAEGESVYFSTDHFRIVHPYYTHHIDEYIVIEAPKYGTIYTSVQENAKVSAKSFTPAEVAEGKIFYQQDSSEVERDWFTLVARSNILDKESLPATVHVLIQPVNDEPPRVVHNIQLDLWQGTEVPLTTVHLAAYDNDTEASEIVFSLVSVRGGRVANVNTNNTVTSFTQEDLELGRIFFAHDPKSVGNASLSFSLTDGRNQSPMYIFNLGILQRRLVMKTNEKLLVGPGQPQSITRGHLRVGTNEETCDTNRSFTYHIIKAPTYGVILLEDKHYERVTSFTQKQIEENLVVYNQNVELNDPIVIDRILFNIESPELETLRSVPFFVEISARSSQTPIINSMVGVNTLVVKEGHDKVIGPEVIDINKLTKRHRDVSSLYFQLTKPPAHGLVLSNGAIVEPEHRLSVGQLTNNSLYYKHDNTEALDDSLELTIFNGHDQNRINLTLTIKVLPINDELPHVINRRPIFRAILETHTELTNSTLTTIDHDGKPFNIIYELRRAANTSTSSFFHLKGRETPIDRFSQEDIDAKRIQFRHRGRQLQFHYWFRVKDDSKIICPEVKEAQLGLSSTIDDISSMASSRAENAHCTPYYPLVVNVEQLALHLTNQSVVQLPQGTYRVRITSSHLSVNSQRSPPENLIYTLRQSPTFGHLSVGNRFEQQQHAFSQADINEGRVYYVQLNNSAEDQFVVDCAPRDNAFFERELVGVEIRIVVQPLIKATRPFVMAMVGQKSLIGLEHLDARELADRTNSNPLFSILMPPKYGYLTKLRFGVDPKGTRTTEIDRFTHDDILHNRIAYVAYADTPYTVAEMIIDTVNYNLTAASVQEAYGVLVINIFHNRTTTNTWSSTSMWPPFKDKSLHTLLNRLVRNRETILIVFLVIIALLLLITLICILKLCPMFCRSLALAGAATSSTSSRQTESTKTLPRNDKCQRENSNSSVRNTDCSSGSTTNSVTNVALLHPDVVETCSGGPLLLPQFHRPNHHEPSFYPYAAPIVGQYHKYSEQLVKGEDMLLNSPLPPPSLYFIDGQNDWTQSQFDLDHFEEYNPIPPTLLPPTVTTLGRRRESTSDEHNGNANNNNNQSDDLPQSTTIHHKPGCELAKRTPYWI